MTFGYFKVEELSVKRINRQIMIYGRQLQLVNINNQYFVERQPVARMKLIVSDKILINRDLNHAKDMTNFD